MPRDSWLLLVCAGRVLMYAIFMVYAACLPVLLVEWDMSATRAGTIAAGFSFSYAVSLLVSSWLAERFGARRVFLASAYTSALTSLAFGVAADGYWSALVLYSLAASTQGGTYTPAIMLFADRYPPERRGSAVGWLIASTSVGYAFSLVMSGWLLPFGGWKIAFLVAGVLPVAGALASHVALRATPNVVHARSGGEPALRFLLRNPNARRLVIGYTGHSWELLGLWAWVPAFLAAGYAASGAVLVQSAEWGAYLSAAMHLVGSVAAFTMGALSDRLGRRVVLLTLAATSCLISMTFGWLIGLPVAVLGLVGLVYNFTSIGDSPVLSTSITEVVEPGYLGSVLAIRALLGFTAGGIAPIVFGAILDATNPAGAPPATWGWAFVSFGAGGLVATVCAWRLEMGRPGQR